MMLSLLECLKKIVESRVNEETMIDPLISGTALRSSDTSNAIQKHNSPTRVLQPAYTIRLRPGKEDPVQAPPSHPAAGPHTLSWSGITDTGILRDHNEDSYSILSFEDKALFVVADGMGGHDGGEVASRIAAETVCGIVQKEYRQDGDLLALLERAVQKANSEVRQEGERRGSNMGTTLSAAIVSNEALYAANVGDSRVYWIAGGSIFQITADHSLVAKLVLAGKLTKEEARTHPRANLLYRTIGNDRTVKVDTFRFSLKEGGILLLCTDGLWGELSDEDIRETCTEEGDVKDMAAKLMQMANERGGKDNITAVVVKVV
jgi:serine/threonine protein phosphatase PrpC